MQGVRFGVSDGGLELILQALTQRAQYPLIKEYSLNHNMKPLMI